MKIIKASGESAVFDESKLLRSLLRAGASESLAKELLVEIRDSLYEGVSTTEIYKKAFGLLRKRARPSAARYKLKKAIMELGETGYPFEKFVGALLAAEGFSTQVGVIVKGACVSHEVDVIAEKDNRHFMCECKFHRLQNRRCDVKIPLYIHSRFKDVEEQWLKKPGHEAKFHQGWIFTNTRFTSDATQYAACAGMQLISWDYPEGNAIRDRVDRTGIHPITCLTTLTPAEKKVLIEKDIITVKNLSENSSWLTEIGIKSLRLKKVTEEISQLRNSDLSKQINV
ncbi:restriction endonuclease [Jiulongibacter sediminis]|uniref:ATPase n=1 Tax=Jiulongibacter sediminis TaxID=1605367 RepID=A0A0P7BWZ9_9BACT|nr:restriction endonuclease [Jiulongibacter sediminis]KPM46577.1 ATPase [Jiulongibacter sediminis]TBX21150.1 ATPase [Jiulongibacter sediminis]